MSSQGGSENIGGSSGGPSSEGGEDSTAGTSGRSVESGSCGCRVPSSPTGQSGLWALTLSGAMLLRRRRKMA